MSTTIATASEKGGVGKTTTAVSLAAALAELGRRVLVVDLDAQGTATDALGAEMADGLFDVYRDGTALTELVRPTNVEGIDLVPAGRDLVALEAELARRMPPPVGRLGSALRDTKGYGWVIIDTPPSLGLATVSALAAASLAVVPVEASGTNLVALENFEQTVQAVRDGLNPRLRWVVVPWRTKPRARITGVVLELIRERFEVDVLPVLIPESVKAGEAALAGETVLMYEPRGRVAEAYRELARLMVDREERKR